MEVAKATPNKSVLVSSTVYIAYFLISLAMATAASGEASCTKGCKCFPVLPDDMRDPLTYNKASESENETGTLTAVSCQRQQLTTVPKGMSQDTAVLILAFNRLTHLNRSMFADLTMIQLLDVSHNRLESIANDTFDKMPQLEQLDLSYNALMEFPMGFLCPWYVPGAVTVENGLGCEGSGKAQTRLLLSMGQNPWHCSCRLQEFLEHFACIYGRSPCIDFPHTARETMGKCKSPQKMRGVLLSSLSSAETKGSNNVCRYVRGRIDVPLLVTIFTWIGAVIGYVVYFILWNQHEVTNHRSYLSTLNFQRENQTSGARSTGLSRPLKVDSDDVFTRRSRPTTPRRTERYEMRPLFKASLAARAHKPSRPGVWDTRSESDTSSHCANFDSVKKRFVQVRPFRSRVRPSVSDPSDLRTECTDDKYHVSSL